MNVLEPELVWVDGRCYRRFGKRESSDHNISPYVEDDDDLDIEDVEEYDDPDIEIVSYGSSRFKHTFHVAKAFFPFIIGSKHLMRKKLEADTKTSIQIPKVGQDGDIVIIGFHPKGIITARRRIDMLITAARRNLDYTHFLSIPLNEGSIIMKYMAFKNDVLKSSEKTSRGIDETIFQIPSKLHITIGMLKLFDDAERERATQALDDCKEHIIKPAMEKYGQIHICLEGLSIMNDDPTETKVLYARVIDENNSLQEIANEIANYYASIDLIDRKQENVLLHVTLMNTRYKNETKRGPYETFDATDILKAHEHTKFADTTLKQIHISQLHTDCNGYYAATAKINLTEGF
ncbi:activating signal cointegrator 1 complex subunit 1 [Megalopta genalis]|uniref:activating signal cointegrator 1 complex subunit 1 n=1 Tax=Megalopta genalis TaxID=115081 RepID=UPI003FD4EE9E